MKADGFQIYYHGAGQSKISAWRIADGARRKMMPYSLTGGRSRLGISRGSATKNSARLTPA
jgi:hypothetical protein